MLTTTTPNEVLKCGRKNSQWITVKGEASVGSLLVCNEDMIERMLSRAPMELFTDTDLSVPSGSITVEQFAQLLNQHFAPNGGGASGR